MISPDPMTSPEHAKHVCEMVELGEQIWSQKRDSFLSLRLLVKRLRDIRLVIEKRHGVLVKKSNSRIKSLVGDQHLQVQ